MQYDIFISYRRNGGDMLAHILYERLTQKGYSVFQDIEVLRSGKFNTAIYEKIEKCKDVILVLSPGALDRCADEEDWVRKEIVCALKSRKNIIPIMLRGFEWPDNLPDAIQEVQFYSGLTASTEYFEQFLDKLTEFLATPEPSGERNNFRQRHTIRGVVMAVIVSAIIFFPLIIIFVLNQTFGLLWRIIYFVLLAALAKFALYEIETRPGIAAACFGTLTEEDLKNPPDIVFSRITSAFGKNIFISRSKKTPFLSLYMMKRLILGTWDGKRTNYVRVLFRRKFEWYDPSVFHLHSLSRGGQAVKMLTRQGFILQSLPNFINASADYLVKDNFHIFLFYKKNKLDFTEIFQCSDEELQDKYDKVCEVIRNEELLER